MSKAGGESSDLPPAAFVATQAEADHSTQSGSKAVSATTTQRATLIAKADEAVVKGDLPRAEHWLLEAMAETSVSDPLLYLKLAGIQRANGRLQEALETVQKALSLQPLDFTALLMRASLLERLEDGAAGEAWTHALAQRPSGNLPQGLLAIVEHAEQCAAKWTQLRETRMLSATAPIEKLADPDELGRIARFRSNSLRKTQAYHSDPTHFCFPGLREREFHPRSLFPWIHELEAATEKVLSEWKRVMEAEQSELVPYVNYDEHLPMERWRPLNHNPDWTAIHLIRNGLTVEANARHCPETMRLLRQVPQPSIAGASPNAMFSLLAPHTAIPPHVGINNARLVCHLPLIVPDGCWFRVGAETRSWVRGKAFVFDDTIEHEAMNPSGELRVVLIFDVWHPDLTPVERDAVAAIVATETQAHGL